MDRIQLSTVLLELLEEETGEKYTGLEESANLRKDLNLDSLDMVSLVLHIENRLEIEIDTDELNEAVTVSDLLDVLQKNLERCQREAA